MKLRVLGIVILMTSFLAGTLAAQADHRDVRAHLMRAKTGKMAKVDLFLSELYEQHKRSSLRLRSDPDPSKWPEVPGGGENNLLMRVRDDHIAIDAVASGDAAALLSELEALGLQNGSTFGNYVSGWIPRSSIEDLAQCSQLKYARASAVTTRTGLTTSGGDIAVRADLVRAGLEPEDDNPKPGPDGTGVRVGAMSDSFDCLGGAADDIASNDLMSDIIVLDDNDCPAGIDEARAILQIIHDLAPGAAGAVHSATAGGQADFANGIIELATVAGSDVIVDDVIFLAEPMFQDGIIAQAVDIVKDMGVAYFSSAGNNGRDAYESNFRNSGTTGAFGGTRHDFDPSVPFVDGLQSVTFGTGQTVLVLQWDDPFFSVSGAPGADSDVDLLFYDANGNLLPLVSFPGGNQLIVFQGGSDNINVTGDPVEVGAVINFGPPITLQVGIEVFAGPDPGFLKYVYFAPSATNVDEFDTASGSLYGHANADGAEAVGAAFYLQTPEFGVDPALIEFFSSAGPTRILFNPDGTPTFEIRDKPEIVATDGGNTTFFPPPPFNPNDVEGDGFPNFFGTSASAPHAAAVAALLLDLKPQLTPDQVYFVLESTALDMNDPLTPGQDVGFDFRTGFGLIDAFAAAIAADDVDDFDDDDN